MTTVRVVCMSFENLAWEQAHGLSKPELDPMSINLTANLVTNFHCDSHVTKIVGVGYHGIWTLTLFILEAHVKNTLWVMYVLNQECHIAWTILYVLSSLILIYEVGVLRKWKHYHEQESDFSQRRTHQDWWTNIHASHAGLFRFHLLLERD